MGAPSKRARKVRTGLEFDAAKLRAMIAAPRDSSAVYSWSLSDIFAARNAQMRGDFRLAARLAESMRTDDALFVAYQNRIAPQRCLQVTIEAAKGARAQPVASEAEALFGAHGVGLHPDTVADIHGALVNHGVAVGYNVTTPREDGSRVDFEHRYWPIEFVRWDPLRQQLMARLDPTTTELPPDSVGSEIPIVHGDGRWVVYQRSTHLPWRTGAVLAASLVWARHAFGMRDWSKSSLTHGLAKVIGELPASVPLQTEAGELSPEAAGFQELLLAMANSDSPVGIRPAGAKTEFVTNSSSAWQIFTQLTENAEKAAARIYLGTDGILGAQGGAPGVDISALFGVATTIVQGDLECIERGIKTGVLDPWCATNFGDSTLAPMRRYVLPDPDADRAVDSLAKRRHAFYSEVRAARDAGLEVTSEYITATAQKYGVDDPARPPAMAPPSATVAPLRAAK